MAGNIHRITRIPLRSVFYVSTRTKSSRTTLGAAPEQARCLTDKLKDLSTHDPTIHYKVDIGFALKPSTRKGDFLGRIAILKENKNNKELEQLARDNKLLIPLEEVERDSDAMVSPLHTRTIAEHYGVYEHLFGDAYFHPVVNMQVLYTDGTIPVYRGNPIKPREALKKPIVNFKSRPDDLWTLIMTTPDGTTNEVERIHWMVANIPGGDVSRGEELCQHIQPLPFEGLGYLRYIFVLYKQEGKIDYSELKAKLATTRFFSTLKFYSKRQDVLTPAGLSFFVSDWDETVRNYYQLVLKKEPPVFEYDFANHYLKKPVWFPLKQPFNLYMDRYRDEKEIAKEFLVKKLKNTDPFKGDLRPKYPFPNAVPFAKGTPSWLKNEIKKERLLRARYYDYK